MTTEPSSERSLPTAALARDDASRESRASMSSAPLRGLFDVVVRFVSPSREVDRLHVAESDRAAVVEAMRRSIEQREAAESLLVAGLVPQALDSFRASEASARAAFDAARSASPAARRTIDAATRTLDAAVALHGDRELEIDARRGALRRVHRALRPLAWDAREVHRVTRDRRAVLVATVVAFVLTAFLSVRILRAPKATASAILAAGYSANAAIDGDPESEWLLPDKSPGWLDLHVRPGRYVTRVRLINALNPPFGDRATERYSVIAYRNGVQIGKIDGAFRDEPGVRAVQDVFLRDRVDRIRIEVTSFFRNGGGLSEVIVK